MAPVTAGGCGRCGGCGAGAAAGVIAEPPDPGACPPPGLHPERAALMSHRDGGGRRVPPGRGLALGYHASRAPVLPHHPAPLL